MFDYWFQCRSGLNLTINSGRDLFLCDSNKLTLGLRFIFEVKYRTQPFWLLNLRPKSQSMPRSQPCLGLNRLYFHENQCSYFIYIEFYGNRAKSIRIHSSEVQIQPMPQIVHLLIIDYWFQCRSGLNLTINSGRDLFLCDSNKLTLGIRFIFEVKYRMFGSAEFVFFKIVRFISIMCIFTVLCDQISW